MTEEFKAYRLQMITEAAESVRRERELAQQLSDEFNLDDVIELIDNSTQAKQ